MCTHVDAGAQLELLGGEMRLGAGARARIIERAGRGLGARDQAGDRLDAGIGAHEQHVRGIDELADRHEILERIIGQIAVERGIDRDRGRGEQERVAVGRGARRDRHAGIAAAAAAVVDDDGLAEGFLERHRDDARDDIGRPARRERHDQGDRPFGIGGVRDAGGDEHRRQGRERTLAERSARRHAGPIPGAFFLPCRHEIWISSPGQEPRGMRGCRRSRFVGPAKAGIRQTRRCVTRGQRSSHCKS